MEQVGKATLVYKCTYGLVVVWEGPVAWCKPLCSMHMHY